MRTHDRRLTILVAILCWLGSGCATTNMPQNWLGDPEERVKDTYGAWIEVRSGDRIISGELIAVTSDSLFVADTVLHTVGSQNVTSAQLVMYSPANITGIVLLGTLSTASNGLFLVFTAPLWLIGGSISAASRYSEALMECPPRGLSEMAPYARFPQGMPSSLDRALIRSKSYTQ